MVLAVRVGRQCWGLQALVVRAVLPLPAPLRPLQQAARGVQAGLAVQRVLVLAVVSVAQLWSREPQELPPAAGVASEARAPLVVRVAMVEVPTWIQEVQRR